MGFLGNENPNRNPLKAINVSDTFQENSAAVKTENTDNGIHNVSVSGQRITRIMGRRSRYSGKG